VRAAASPRVTFYHGGVPDAPPPLPPQLRLPARCLAEWPHLPAFWPDRAVEPIRGELPLPFATGPFRPARLGGREVPVALVDGASPDPVGAALAGPEVPPPDDLPALLARFAAGRIGAPPGLPDPGPEALGLRRGGTVVVLDPGDPARRAETAARLEAARAGAAGRPVVLAADPFAAGPALLPGALPPQDPWTLLDAASDLHGASRDLALLALAAGVRLADGPLAGADPLGTWGRLLAATRCADPFRRMPCGLADAIDLLALWKQREAEGRRVAVALHIHPYKRDRVRELVASAAPAPAFHGNARRAIAAARGRGGALLAWSASATPTLRAEAAAAGVDLIWLEDGFIRSAGLGAAFRAGASFALDTRGPYYDPGAESDLEHLLATVEFPETLRQRAAALRAAIVARGVTKYNLRGVAPVIAAPAGRPRILVPGQVEDDASVRRGGAGISGNLELLRRVRAAVPEAWLVYKPHPDIEAGFRRGRIAAPDLAGLADQVLEQAPMDAVLRQVDAVHTLTSLTGFEALLRGLPVTCWGVPFYAGWGLTEDRAPVPRRGRRLALDELVAGALILYPRCIDPLTGLPCPPEVLLERMDRPELFPPGRRAGIRAVQGLLTRGLARLRGWR
jgi:capsular polysaccharide export protein